MIVKTGRFLSRSGSVAGRDCFRHHERKINLGCGLRMKDRYEDLFLEGEPTPSKQQFEVTGSSFVLAMVLRLVVDW